MVWDIGTRGILVGLWDLLPGGGPDFFANEMDLSVLLTRQQYESRGATYETGEELQQLRDSKLRAPLDPSRWPRVIHIVEPNEYRSIRILPPDSSEAIEEAMGFGSHFDGFFLERSDDPVTRGIETKLAILDPLWEAQKAYPWRKQSVDEVPDWRKLRNDNFKVG